MTIIVGIRCKDGVVIGADSSATFGSGPFERTIEVLTSDQVIVAGTGWVGHQQRFKAQTEKLFAQNDTFGRKTGIEIGTALSAAGAKDFISTRSPAKWFAALAAYKSSDHLFNLCEFSLEGFQSEVKEPNGLWWVAIGSGQAIADPFLALLAQVFWPDGPPPLQGGIFTALWALEHACKVNPGGIQEPIHMATLSADPADRGKVRAKMMDPDSLAEHRNMVKAATAHLATFRDVLEGSLAMEVPKVAKPPGGTPAAPPQKDSNPLPGLPGHKPQS